MYCRSCGESNPDKANFCGNCGRPLGSSPLTHRPKAKPKGIRGGITLLFFLSLATYFFYLIVEVKTFESRELGQPFRDKIGFLKERSRDKNIDFYLVLTSQEIDGYLNEEFFKKPETKFTSIHTTFTPEEIEVGLSGNFLYLPTVFRVKARPVERGEEIKLIISGMSLGHLPIPSIFYPLLYRFYPWLNFDYWLSRSGVKLKEIRLEKDSISFKGVWRL